MLLRLWRNLFDRPSTTSPLNHGSTDHAASPVPWVTDAIWSHWLSRRRATGHSDKPELHPVLRDPRLYVISRDDLKRAPSAAIEPGAPIPKWKWYYDNLNELKSLRADLMGIFDPSWPMCCGRLATVINEQGIGRSLASVEAETGPLDLAFMEMEVWHDWAPRSQEEIDRAWHTGYRETLERVRNSGAFGGLLLFQCRACGRVYMGSCTP